MISDNSGIVFYETGNAFYLYIDPKIVEWTRKPGNHHEYIPNLFVDVAKKQQGYYYFDNNYLMKCLTTQERRLGKEVEIANIFLPAMVTRTMYNILGNLPDSTKLFFLAYKQPFLEYLRLWQIAYLDRSHNKTDRIQKSRDVSNGQPDVRESPRLRLSDSFRRKSFPKI
jgi:hypothetical protein